MGMIVVTESLSLDAGHGRTDLVTSLIASPNNDKDANLFMVGTFCCISLEFPNG